MTGIKLAQTESNRFAGWLTVKGRFHNFGRRPIPAHRGITLPRIAIVFEFGSLNGGERSMLAALDHLDRQHFEPVALAPTSGRLAEELKLRQVRHVPFARHDASGTRLSRQRACDCLLNTIAACQPDLVHANSLSMGRLTGTIAGRLKVPCISHLRDIMKLSRTAIAVLNENRLLLAVSRATQDFYVASGLDPLRVQVVYNGVDCQLFHPRAATGQVKRQLDLAEDCFLAGSIGQIALRKGQRILADAAVRAADRLPKVHYVLVGERNSRKIESIEYEQAVFDTFRQGRIEGRYHRLGYRRDVSQLLNEFDLLVHAAHQEPLGRVLLEAAASGLAILATRVGGTAEILDDGRSARLVEPGNADALCAGLIELRGDAGLRQRLAEQARRQIEERFSIEKAAAELCSVWETALAGHG